MALEILHRSLVLLRFREGGEGAQISSFGRFGILFSRIQPIAASLEFFDHGGGRSLDRGRSPVTKPG